MDIALHTKGHHYLQKVVNQIYIEQTQVQRDSGMLYGKGKIQFHDKTVFFLL